MTETLSEELAVVDSGAEIVTVDYRPELDPVRVYLAGLGSEKSRRSQLGSIRVIAKILGCPVERVPWAALTYSVTNAIRARLIESFAPATANKALCALRAVLREAWRLGLMSSEAQASAGDLRPAKGSRLLAGRALSRSEFRKLFRACAADPKAGKRDAAMLALLLGNGLRRAELVSLDLANWDPSAGTIKILGKGSKERLGFVISGRPYLDAWVQQRGLDAGPLFVAVGRGGHLLRHRLSDNAVLLVLKRMAKRAGVAPFSPHDCRRSAVTHLLDEGVDLAAVQKYAGHSSPLVTARYDRRSDEVVRAATSKLRF